jgi:hypothetical protein
MLVGRGCEVAGMHWVLMLFVILAAVMGGREPAIVAMRLDEGGAIHGHSGGGIGVDGSASAPSPDISGLNSNCRWTANTRFAALRAC